MYEIWLALNIVWETLLPLALPLAAALVFLAVLWAAALLGGTAHWRPGLGWASAAAVATALVAFAAIPAFTRSSLVNLGYWVDYAVLAALSVGAGTAVGLYVWPVAAMLAGGSARVGASARRVAG